MSTISWSPILAVVLIAAAIDVCTRRIPNWISIPTLLWGLGINAYIDGIGGLIHSLEGIGLAVLLVGLLCWLKGMGMGDLKLCAAVGAWIGPSPLTFALLMSAIAGGFVAVAYILVKGRSAVAFDRAAALLFTGSRSAQLPAPDVTQPGAFSIPYAPAIAIGVIFSYFANLR